MTPHSNGPSGGLIFTKYVTNDATNYSDPAINMQLGRIGFAAAEKYTKTFNFAQQALSATSYDVNVRRSQIVLSDVSGAWSRDNSFVPASLPFNIATRNTGRGVETLYALVGTVLPTVYLSVSYITTPHAFQVTNTTGIRTASISAAGVMRAIKVSTTSLDLSNPTPNYAVNNGYENVANTYVDNEFSTETLSADF